MPSRPVILITGSSGFIGSAIGKRLAQGHQVVGLDNEDPREPIAGVETIRVDLTSDQNVRDALAQVRQRFGTRIASVIHLAAYYDLSGEPDPKSRRSQSREHAASCETSRTASMPSSKLSS